MASCDDDFGLLGSESHSQVHHHHSHHHHHHQTVQQQIPLSHRYISPAAASSSKGGGGGVSIHCRSLPPPPPLNTVASPPKLSKGGVEEHYTEAFAQAGVNHCFTTTTAEAGPGFAPQSQEEEEDVEDDEDEDGDHRSRGDADAARHLPPPLLSSRHQHPQQQLSDSKRKDRDEISDGESPCSIYYNNNNKKLRSTIGLPCSPSGEYRKDREEWSDSAIACLLDAYTDKYIQLNRGNLRGRDWEDVAATVSERSEKHKLGKSVEQCKNKVDNLKKRYKVECQRLSSGSLAGSHWPWFKKMEQIVGSSPSSSKAMGMEDDKLCPLGSGATSMSRQQLKRYPAAPSSACLGNNNLRMKLVSNSRWKRVVLKISGAALSGSGPQNVDPKVILLIAREVALASRAGVEVAIVVGGRNFFCGDTWVAATDTDKATAYQIGMMASAMNSLLLQSSLEKIGVETRVQTAFMVQEIAEPYIRRRAIRHLEKGRVVIFSGIGAGMGNPLLSTDTAAALRASEINADVLVKGINMDHGYECHSRPNSAAFEHVSFKDLDSRCFSSVDMTAITFCAENNIPVVFFNLLEPGNISRALCGDQVGTLIDQLGRIS